MSWTFDSEKKTKHPHDPDKTAFVVYYRNDATGKMVSFFWDPSRDQRVGRRKAE